MSNNVTWSLIDSSWIWRRHADKSRISSRFSPFQTSLKPLEALLPSGPWEPILNISSLNPALGHGSCRQKKSLLYDLCMICLICFFHFSHDLRYHLPCLFHFSHDLFSHDYFSHDLQWLKGTHFIHGPTGRAPGPVPSEVRGHLLRHVGWRNGGHCPGGDTSTQRHPGRHPGGCWDI